MNQKKKSFLKKSTAAAAAAILCVSAAPASVLTAESYTETARTAISKMAESFAAEYQKSFDTYETVKTAQTANWSLTLGETSIALLGQLLGTDMSWFENIKIVQNQGISDSGTYVNMDLMVNDSKVCTLEMLVDSQTSDVYMRVLELSDAYLHVSADQMENASGSLNIMATDILESMPDASVIKDLLNKYGSMLVAHMEDQEAASETLTAEDVAQECTVVEGTISQEQAQDTIKDILKEARDDQQIKSILDDFSQFADGKDLYTAMTEGIDSALKELENGSVSESLEDLEEKTEEVITIENPSSPLDQIMNKDDSYLCAKMWVDENDEIVGQEFAFCSTDGESVPFFTYQTPSAEGKSAFLLSISDGSEGFTFSGSGDVSDNVLNGTYALAVNDIPFLSIGVSDYLTDSAQTDKSGGTYTISLAEWSEDLSSIIDESTYSMLCTFGLSLGYNSEGTSGGFDLSLITSGQNLGTLSMTADVAKEEPAVPDASTFETVYSVQSEEDMQAYLSNADIEGLINNLVNAGVPQELITALMSGGSDEEEYYDEEYDGEEYSDDAYYDDQAVTEEPAA